MKQISPLEVVEELKGEFTYLSHVNIRAHHATDDFVFFLVTKRHRPMMVGENGKTADYLASKLGKRVRIIAGNDEKEIASEVLYPAEISGIDHAYAGGDETLRIRVPISETKRVPITPREASAVLTKL